MTSITFFFIFIPLLAFILLAVNLILAPHNPYNEKSSPFECGFYSFLHQNRTQFHISFFIPYLVSAYINSIYGLIIVIILLLVLTIGFVFELGKGALKISSRQYSDINNIYKYNIKDIWTFTNLEFEG